MTRRQTDLRGRRRTSQYIATGAPHDAPDHLTALRTHYHHSARQTSARQAHACGSITRDDLKLANEVARIAGGMLTTPRDVLATGRASHRLARIAQQHINATNDYVEPAHGMPPADHIPSDRVEIRRPDLCRRRVRRRQPFGYRRQVGRPHVAEDDIRACSPLDRCHAQPERQAIRRQSAGGDRGATFLLAAGKNRRRMLRPMGMLACLNMRKHFERRRTWKAPAATRNRIHAWPSHTATVKPSALPPADGASQVTGRRCAVTSVLTCRLQGWSR